MLRLASSLASTLLLLATACSSAPGELQAPAESTPDGATPGGERGVSPDGALEVIVPAAPVALRRHATADVTVNIARRGIQGEVTLSPSALPAGVSALPLTIAAGESKGVLRLTGNADAPLGRASSSLVASIGTSKASAQLKVDVSAGSGDLDETYGAAGKSETPLGGTAYAGRAAMQKDGKVVFLALVNLATPSRSTKLVRLDANGKRDAAFPEAFPGLATTSFVAFETGPNDTLVFAGDSGGDSSRPFVGRLTPSGALDATFGGGIVRIEVSATWRNQSAYGMAVQPDGKILVATEAHQSTSKRSPVFRYTPSGTPDTTFGNGGSIEVTPEGPASPFVAPDGKILLLSPSSISPPRPVVARTSAAGALDATFGKGGIVARPASGAAFLSNGTSYVWTRNELSRIDVAGTSDPAFKSWTAPPDTQIKDVLVFENGTLWIGATTATLRADNGTYSFAEHVFALDGRGEPVRQFGQDGHITPPLPPNYLMRTADGKVGDGRRLERQRPDGAPHALTRSDMAAV